MSASDSFDSFNVCCTDFNCFMEEVSKATSCDDCMFPQPLCSGIVDGLLVMTATFMGFQLASGISLTLIYEAM